MPFQPNITDEELSQKLLWMDMKRERGLEEYERELGLNITQLAKEKIRTNGKFLWYDLCCGVFAAGVDLKYKLVQNGENDIASRIYARGIDICTTFPEDHALSGNIVISRGNVADYPIPRDVDLVTCFQGLRYVEEHTGRGAEALRHWYNSIREGAILTFDTTLNLVRVGPMDTVEYLVKELGSAVSVKAEITGSMNYRVNITKPNNNELTFVSE